jgi:uncharacterized membrane protein YphA (DoxX/SURF4 family)
VSGDLRKISLLAVVLLVLLRVSIGWHLMYEGLWKLSTLKTSTPWSAEGYLKNSTGPMRSTFRAMTGDPNDLKWLDYDYMTSKWNAWRERFTAHFALDNNQRARLNQMLDGAKDYTAALEALPPGIDAENMAGVSSKVIKFDAKAKRLVVDGKRHLTPVERDRLIDTANELKESQKDQAAAYDAFLKAVNDVYSRSARLSFTERLAATLKGDPERVGVTLQDASTAGNEEKGDAASGTVVQVGEIDYYKELIKRFDANYAKASTKSEWDHVEKQWKDLQDLRRKLVSPVQALDQELMTSAEELLTTDQLALGPAPEPWTPVRKINWRTMWGLTIFGLLLILGLCTRLSALGGAALLTLFYLAMPPWPGVQEIPSIEHNLFVNKVFVEMLALLAIAALPSGKWFGLDAAVSALLQRRPKVEKT